MRLRSESESEFRPALTFRGLGQNSKTAPSKKLVAKRADGSVTISNRCGSTFWDGHFVEEEAKTKVEARVEPKEEEAEGEAGTKEGEAGTKEGEAGSGNSGNPNKRWRL
ncbi:hypothetical protein QYF36_021766 [Acer negundo]|nr:hypothetical protein QYF36_021766 [Acer negundo]